MNYKRDQQRKEFGESGLSEGDQVRNKLTGVKGTIYISVAGYACVRPGEFSGVIWTPEFVRESIEP